MKGRFSFTYSVYDSTNNFLGCFSSLFLAKNNLRPGYYIIRRDSFGHVLDKIFRYETLSYVKQVR